MPSKIVIVGGSSWEAQALPRKPGERMNPQKFPFLSGERMSHLRIVDCLIMWERQSLIVMTCYSKPPESFWKRFRVKVHARHEVLGIKRQEKYLEVRNLQTGFVFNEPYDKLILAPGAGAIVPPLPGIEAKNIFTVKTVPDSDAIKSFLAHYPVTNALVIGGGFIGLETAEALKNRGLSVTIVEMAPQILPSFDTDMARLVAQHLQEKGVHLVLGDGIKAFREI